MAHDPRYAGVPTSNTRLLQIRGIPEQHTRLCDITRNRQHSLAVVAIHGRTTNMFYNTNMDLGTWHLVKSRDRTASSERRTVYELWLKQRRITSQAQMHGHYSLHDITVAPLGLAGTLGRAALRTSLDTRNAHHVMSRSRSRSMPGGVHCVARARSDERSCSRSRT